MSEQFLSEVDLAARWAMSSKTLTRWRGKRRGPPFVKLGGAVRYGMSDVLEFERHGLRKPLPRQVTPDEPTPSEVIQNLTVRDMVAVLRTDVQ
jgi:predicted DNA-binding transcriptional regulator AlpA